MVLARLSTASMRLNISKSMFFVEKIEYLGYWITIQGIQSICNMVEVIFNTKAPKTRRQQQSTPFYWYSQLSLQRVIFQKSASSQIPLTKSHIKQGQV
jgi:hypothetical protein